MPCGVGRRQGSAFSLPDAPFSAGLELRPEGRQVLVQESSSQWTGEKGFLSSLEWIFVVPFGTSSIKLTYQPGSNFLLFSKSDCQLT